MVLNDDIRLCGLDTLEPYALADSRALYVVPPVEMLVEDVQPVGTITGLTAAPGVGKTWFALEMARAVATGTKFLGRFPARQGAVLFIGSDSSLPDYARQWRRLTMSEWSRMNEVDEIDPEPDDNPLDDNVRFLIQSTFMLDNLDTVRKLVRTSNNFMWGPLEEHLIGHDEHGPKYDIRHRRGFDLIVFDTFSKLTRGNQNDNTITEECFRNARFITEQTGSACLILHHNGNKTEFNRQGDNWRGASAAPGALDNRIQLNSTDKDKYMIKAEYMKFRGITPEAFHYVMMVDDEETAKLHYVDKTSTVTNYYSNVITDGIIEFLRGYPGVSFTTKEIVTALHPAHALIFPDVKSFQQTIYKRLFEEKENTHSRIIVTGGGGKYDPYRYEAKEMQHVLDEDKDVDV